MLIIFPNLIDFSFVWFDGHTALLNLPSSRRNIIYRSATTWQMCFANVRSAKVSVVFYTAMRCLAYICIKICFLFFMYTLVSSFSLCQLLYCKLGSPSKVQSLGCLDNITLKGISIREWTYKWRDKHL